MNERPIPLTPDHLTARERRAYEEGVELDHLIKRQQEKRRERHAELDAERGKNLLGLVRAAGLFWTDLGVLEQELKAIALRLCHEPTVARRHGRRLPEPEAMPQSLGEEPTP
jgi:hypothetical protein